LTKATDRLSQPFSADAARPEIEPAGTQLEPPFGSASLDRIWGLTLASLRISPRESEIIESILPFADDEASIAARLRMSPSTVHAHLGRLYRKVGVTNRWQLMVKLLLAYIATRRTHGGQFSGSARLSTDELSPASVTIASASPGVRVRWTAARGERSVPHQDGRSARPRARRDDGE
jgi:DNA-binding CsgD family transcriptional regulator